MMDFLSFLDSTKLHVETQHKLLSNTVNLVEALHALHQSDLVQFDLPLGQLRLLQKLLGMGEGNASNTSFLNHNLSRDEA